MRKPVDDPKDNIAAAARRGARSSVRRRFYAEAVTAPAGAAGYAVLLDGKPIRTPARRALTAPSPAVALAIAAEWQAQREQINPASMPLTRLANSIIDGVTDHPVPVAAEVAKYLACDLLFYRAAAPAGLVERQRCHWDPILAWADETFGARFELAQGIRHVTQPAEALAAASAAIPNDPWPLGALHVATTLTGSALIALALARRRLEVETAWLAANVDEDWNMEQWGRDELALDRRAFRFAEFQAAATMLHVMAP